MEQTLAADTPPRRPGWLGPLRLPTRWTRGWVPGFRALGERFDHWPRWLSAAILLGVGPVFLDVAVGCAISHLLTPLLGLPLLLAATARDRFHPTLTCLGLVFLFHSGTVIALAATVPELLAPVQPDGAGYWDETENWLRTGQSRAYDVGAWGPVHFRLAAVMAVWGYLSLGLVPLLQGLYELDLMNFYVGQLLAHSRGPSPVLLLAWHPWSLCRGVGFLLVTFELASLSLARLTGIPISPTRRRVYRWAMGIAFLLLDAAVKWSCSEQVRQALAGQLAD
jgi:hypothetical protein